MKESVRKAFEAIVGGEIEGAVLAERSPSPKLLRLRERLSRPQSLTKDALIEHARHIAEEQIAEVSGRGSRELYQAFSRYCRKIEEAHYILSSAAADRDLLTPGAEWLLDNYHVIQEHIVSIHRDFPRGYDKTLPKLLNGKYKGYPRVYELALEVIAKSDSVVDPYPLTSFITGYQSASELTIGELWAIPIMLRFALVENVSNLAERFVVVREERKAAEQFIDEIIGDESTAGTEILLVLAARLKADPDLLITSAPYLIRRLRERGRKATITLQWLEERLREEGAEPDEVLRNEQYALAADQISIGNSVTSLKAISFADWKGWVESVSLVDRALKRDPAHIFSKCDFKTRDRCRHTIEKIAKRGKLLERIVAEAAVELAEKNSTLPSPADESERIRWNKKSNATFYLLRPEGREKLEKQLGIRPGILKVVGKSIKRNAFLAYASLILFGSLVAAGLFLGSITTGSYFVRILLFFVAITPASDLITNILQWIITRVVPPDHLPKLDFQLGIPPEHRTAIIVQSIFSDQESSASTIEGLEVHYLANSEENAVFGILADLRDADAEETPTDGEIISAAKARIAELNLRHGQRFFILFRRRRFNKSENKWMAWERKRGKIEQFNALLLDPAKRGDFIISDSDWPLLTGIRCVVTLDNDSQLPRGTVYRLVGVAAHPLNVPVFEGNRVVDGYGIIQPRIGTTLVSAHASRFANLFSGQAGLDPYSETVSEVYQDLFGEGSFIGKGLYRVETFQRALHNRVPENALLSHDLFEGNFARSGLATDIEFFDDYPSKYHVHSRRLHRWIRGDWQLLPWLGWRVPLANGEFVPNDLPPLAQWKILDNLRRSLVAPTLFLALFLSWIFLPNSSRETFLVVLVLAFPIIANIAQALLVPPSRSSTFGSHFMGLGRDLAHISKQVVFSLAVLPHQTVSICDAILRTLHRVFISKKHLLEWETAYHADKRLKATLGSFVREMRGGLLLTFFTAGVLLFLRPEVFFWNLPVIALWVLAPWIAFYFSSPIRSEHIELKADAREYLTQIAWSTWRYFRELLTEENQYLVPDNIQLVPVRVVAHRTSPTNISLSMLSAISAYELGFFTLGAAVERIRKTLDTLVKLERFRGHFINWYDCISLRPLPPRYVSTVDSGNLVGHFIAIRSFLRTLSRRPVLHVKHREHSIRILKAAGVHAEPIDVNSIGAYVRSVEQLRSRLVEIRDDKLQRDLEDLFRPADRLRFVATFQEMASARMSEPSEANIADVKLDAAHRALEGELSPDCMEDALQAVSAYADSLPPDANGREELISQVIESSSKFQLLREQADSVTKTVSQIISEHDFHFLYDNDRELFSIGYHVDHARRDGSFYDLLASEARLSGLVAIAIGQAPQKHWFALGRALADSPGGKLLLSWSGTMFEYLMPIVVTRDYPGTILSETYKAVVKAQQIYAKRKGVPWGISESSFSGVDFEKTYQYRAFGVPGLGLKRGLEDDLVISPYSTALALQVAPIDAIENFKALEREGARGEYGFFEAIDYTPERLSINEKKHVVQNFFAHHQGMSLCALTNVLANNPIQELFHADPNIKATELLLQERFPDKVATVSTPALQPKEVERPEDASGAINATVIDTPHTSFPRTQLLSNGRYSVMVDNGGSGFSVMDRDLFLTRWKEDLITNRSGSYIYLKDRKTNFIWSTTYQPTCVEPESYEVLFSPDKVEYKRRDRNVFIHKEITVSPEDNVEIRRVSLINLSGDKKTIEVTSFGEVALNAFRADQAHPAFSKMFIQSEFLPEFDCLVFARRPRSQKDQPQFFFHMLTMRAVWERVDYDSSRFSFLGRCNTAENPAALHEPLKSSHGSVLDPIFSLRTGLEIEPGHAESLNFISGYASNRDELMALIRRYKELHQISRAFEMAWSQASVELRNEQMSAKLFPVFQRLGNVLLFNLPQFRGAAEIIQRSKLTQQNLWRFGISGDLPLAVARITEPNQTRLVQELLAAHHYLRVRGLSFDLLILNEYPGGYLQTLQEELDYTIRTSLSGGLIEKSGGVFLRSITQMADEERDLVAKVARVVFNGSQGSLNQQLKFEEKPLEDVIRKKLIQSKALKTRPRLELDNSYGGFVENGKGYGMVVGTVKPPLPYSNVIANPTFGFLVTESGGGYTWSENSRENRLTPWSNDPVSDPVSEVVYLRDRETGAYWSATPQPASHGGEYQVEHLFGASRFETESSGISSILALSVSGQERVKFFSLRISNRTKERRQIDVILYVECVLGVQREEMVRYQHTVFDPVSQCLLVSNNYNGDFPGRVVALGSSHGIVTYTASRADFIGRNRSQRCPLAFDSTPRGEIRFSRKTGTGFDQCGALSISLELGPGQNEEITFFLAEFQSIELARRAVPLYRESAYLEQEVVRYRGAILSATTAVEVKTPSRTFDLIMNGWLPYQVGSSRLFGRTGLYQSGGAFGFRDQLQDVLALLFSRPEIVRAQLLLHASRQFPEGDVQHWWHPPSGKGVRTKITDDFLWMPFVASRYYSATGDSGIFNEEVRFIEGPLLGEHEHETYIVPRVSDQQSSFYDHCIRAIERGLHFGSHGLPLMGVGDWNDGMNEVGKDGRGESVWLGWFLACVLKEFLPIVEMQSRDHPSELERLERYKNYIPTIVQALEENAWDGEWYRRAYFDDGTPLGSATNDECQIDSLPQTWSILSGLGREDRRQSSMSAVYERLVDEKLRVIKLFDPPFDTGSLRPGYIKGYLPGVRENGGQYTHAAVWVVMAAAATGDGERAFRYFQYINPVNHTSTKAGADKYMGEPYVLCGDVYAAPPFEGRAGWSWYTGSASWLYQAGLTSILGINLHPDGFELKPCIPPDWDHFLVVYNRGGCRYEINVENPNRLSAGKLKVRVDGQDIEGSFIKYASTPVKNRVEIIAELYS